MDEIWVRFWGHLADRLHGPLTFRLILQPLVAVLFALRDGYQDSLAGRAPYFWALFTQPGHRAELIRDGWKAVAKVFVVAVLIDIVYQLIVFRWFYPVEALAVGVLLALVPYLLLRGPVNRILQPFVKGRRRR